MNTPPLILIVEDDPVAQIGLQSILSSYDYNIEVATHAGEAITKIEGGLNPKLIFLDMIAPSCDGWQFLARRMKNPSLAACAVIIMTGLGVASPEWARSMGAAGLLRKPINIEEMLDMIGHHCDTGANAGRAAVV